MAFLPAELLSIGLERDEEQHRVYRVRYRVESDDTATDANNRMIDGPRKLLTQLAELGMATPGQLYQLEVDDDPWAYALPVEKIDKLPKVGDRPGQFWIVEQQFTTRYIKRKLDIGEREDPFLERDRVSINFNTFSEEGTFDRFGGRIVNSAHEVIRGPQNEWDSSRTQVVIEQTSPTLDLQTLTEFMLCVNDEPLWDLPARCWRLSGCRCEQLFWRFDTIWRRTLHFDGWLRGDDPAQPNSSGWDRDILDEGTKVLRGRWQNLGTASAPVWTWALIGNPDPSNPAHFQRFQDINGNVTRVILDGSGKPYQPVAGTTTTACSQCPTGAPLAWQLNGWSELGSFFAPLDGMLLAHVAGCTWRGTQAQSGFTYVALLEYTGLWRLVLTLASTTKTLTKAAASWSCNAANELTNVDSSSIPTKMTVSPVAANSPGTIHVEKYHGANFLELDVPTNLED